MFNVSNIDTLLKTNQAINSLFKEKESFSVVRIGNTEGYVLQCLDKGQMPVDQFKAFLFYTAGVFPVDYEYLSSIYAPYNFKAMNNADLLGFIDISGEIRKDESFVSKFNNDKFLIISAKSLIEISNPEPTLIRSALPVFGSFIKKIQASAKSSEYRNSRVGVPSPHSVTESSLVLNLVSIEGITCPLSG